MKRQRRLTRTALAQLVAEESPDPDAAEERHAQQEDAIEKQISLNQQRLETVVTALKQTSARQVIDLGYGQGNLLRILDKDSFFERICGVDVSHHALKVARERLEHDRLAAKQQERIQLLQGALTYRDQRFSGYDAATVIEVIEHLDLPRQAVFERVLFEFAQPKVVIVTTPNQEYNIKFETLAAGQLRHQDHRFEWTRAEFAAWADRVAAQFGYTVEMRAIGSSDPQVGSPTQMGIFTQEASRP